MSEPQQPDLDELWTALEPHIDWPRGSALILLFASHPQPVDELRRRAEALLQDGERTLRTLVPRSVDELRTTAGDMLTPVADEVRAVWIELWRGSGGAGWDPLVAEILRFLNERRAVLEQVVRRPTVLVLPSSLRTQFYVIAPDLWTIRSFTADLPSPRGLTREPSVPRSPVRPTFALPPPSAEEKEWARLLDLGAHSRIDPWDGIRALEAAMRRGSLANARRIAQQVIALIVRGEIGDDVDAMTTDEILRLLPETIAPTYQRELLAAVIELGDIEVDSGNLPTARTLFQWSLGVGEQLAFAAPHDELAQWVLSTSLERLSAVESQAGNISAAILFARRSLDLCEQRASASPQDPRALHALCMALINFGAIEVEAGNFSNARPLFQRSLHVNTQRVLADPYDTLVLRDMVISLNRLGDIELDAGNLSAARSLFQRSLGASEQLASADPHSARALRDITVSLQKLGSVELDAGNLSAACSLFQRSLEISEQLASADPHSVQAQFDHVHAHTRFIDLGQQLDDLDMQREHLQAAQSLLDLMAAQGLVDGHAQAEWLNRYLKSARERLTAEQRS